KIRGGRWEAGRGEGGSELPGRGLALRRLPGLLRPLLAGHHARPELLALLDGVQDDPELDRIDLGPEEAGDPRLVLAQVVVERGEALVRELRAGAARDRAHGLDRRVDRGLAGGELGVGVGEAPVPEEAVAVAPLRGDDLGVDEEEALE